VAAGAAALAFGVEVPGAWALAAEAIKTTRMPEARDKLADFMVDHP
jgi:hypothetical protein